MDDRGTSSMVETEAAAAEMPVTEDWTQAPWRKLERCVYRLQKRIYQAQGRGDVRAVHSLQRLLMKSRAARALAVRKVTQDNAGKKTAGIDGISHLGPAARLLLVERLRACRQLRAKPVRRVWIPKPGKEEKRPLGIPVMMDRAHQALVKLALEPQWERRFEANSYGFRPGRSGQDALDAIFLDIVRQAKYVLDADIKGCFDNIDHQALLGKVGATPAIQRACKGWLKAGVLEGSVYHRTTSGTPQGGVISPLLANIALHGLEDAATQHRRGRKLIRYADDFVFLSKDLPEVRAAQERVEGFLATMGLRLSPEKTRIAHTLHVLPTAPAGFDFLGFTVRQFPVGKCHSGTNGRKQLLGFKTLIKPSKGAIARHRASMRRSVRRDRSLPPGDLIDKLNPLIRGWANYYRACVASRAFQSCDHTTFTLLWSWARFRHPRKVRAWIAAQYWTLQPRYRWTFVAKDGGYITHRLTKHAKTRICRHIKVKGTASPFDGNLLYWSTRLKNHPLTGSTTSRLLAAQQGRCTRCGLLFLDGERLEIDHVLPIAAGGTQHSTNLQVLHRHCHDQKGTP